MKQHKILLLLGTILCVLSAPLPNSQSTCGSPSIVTYETVLPSAEVDDYQVHFVSDNNQIVFVRTTDGQVYRSSDEGVTWIAQTVSEILPNFNESRNDQIKRIAYGEEKTGNITIYLVGSKPGTLWVSKDSGVSYTYYETLPANTVNLFVHSKNHGKVLARNFVSSSTHDLYLSEDYGATWRRIIDSISSWATISWTVFPHTNPNRIYVLRYKNPENPARFDGEVIYSDDFFATKQSIPITNVNSWFMVSPDRLVISSCVDTITCEKKSLHISDDAGQTFSKASFPDTDKETEYEQDFWVPEITDDAIWVQVSRSCNSDSQVCYGDLFHSNDADKDFTLSLPYQRIWDFTKYQSLDGIYIVNQYVTQGNSEPQRNMVRSLITFNKGSLWRPIKAPERDANGQPTDCKLDEGCSLHVHGWAHGDHMFTYFYSIPNAIGLMIASGNLGNYLQEDKINTYVSFNGGVDWEEVAKGSWVPEIGDHGSIITLVPVDGDPSNTLIYTNTNGDEWKQCTFTPTPFDIKNVRVSQGWDSRRFIVYGQRTSQNGTKNAILVHVNFDDTFTGQCTEKNGDFEDWTPKSDTQNCVMGRSTTYTRRKRGKTCYLGEEFEHEVSTENCACVAEDYECDYCFYRPTLSSPCVLECEIANMPTKPAFCANSTKENPLSYPVDIGYRKVDGDTCVNGTKPKGFIPCDFANQVTPTPQPPSSGTLIVVVIILVLIASLIAGFIFVWKKNDRFRHWMSEKFGIDAVMMPVGGRQGESLADNDNDLEYSSDLDNQDVPLDDEEK